MRRFAAGDKTGVSLVLVESVQTAKKGFRPVPQRLAQENKAGRQRLHRP